MTVTRRALTHDDARAPARVADRDLRYRVRAVFSSKRTVPASRPALLLALLVAPGLAASACAPGDPQGSEGETANETEATGEDPTADPGETTSQELVDAPTWYQDVAPIVVSRCGGCHRDGGIAPFALDSYEAAAPWATPPPRS